MRVISSVTFVLFVVAGVFAQENLPPPKVEDAFIEKQVPDYRRLQEHGLLFVSENKSWIDAGFSYRDKSGDSGTSHLEEWTQPQISTRVSIGESDAVELSVRRFNLDAHDLPSLALIGNYPVATTPWTYAPTTCLDELYEPHISFRRDGENIFFVDGGTTPLNAPVFPLPIGRAGGIFSCDAGYWQAEVFGDLKRESLLSYTGISDPYSGKNWGRVIETGGRVSGYVSLGEDWGFYGKCQAAWITGENVEENQHVNLAWNVGRNVPIPNFRYFSMGPALGADYYAKNLSHFTMGHGGYFSPRYFVQGGAALNFLTQETENFLARGYAFTGVQSHEEASSPYFPLADDGRRYGYNQNASFTSSFNGEILWRLTDFCQWVNQASYSKSSNYNEWTASSAFRFLWE
ncbi:MAG: cellulose synthase subunit BcsC-related outer membrane protein [Verrucomicrobiota bacterium]